MKALTLTQPWASLVAVGAKRIETRGWNTHYRGPLAIHSSAKYPGWAKDYAKLPAFAEALGEEPLPLGCVIAVCDLVGTFSTNGKIDVPLTEYTFGDLGPNRYGWVLANVRALPEPIPAKGKLNLWEWTPDAR